MSTRVLITGAGGFVGSSLARGFAELGWKVIGLDRGFDPRQPDDGVHRVEGDLADGVPADLPEVDVVVHAAWVTTAPSTLGVTPAEHVASNLQPLLAVLRSVTRTEPEAFVFLSSSGVFAPADAARGLTDADRPTGSSAYAAAKRAGELLAPAALADSATAVHVVRLGYLFGPGETARPSRAGVSLVADWLGAARAGRPLQVRSDDPRRDWTFTPDLAAALERLVGGGAAGRPVHLGSPHVVGDRALAALITAAVPGAVTTAVPSLGRVKPPMIPSDLPALRGFRWTAPREGLRALLAAEVPA